MFLRLIGNLIILILVIAVVFLAINYFRNGQFGLGVFSFISTFNFSTLVPNINNTNQVNLSYPTSVPRQIIIPQNQTVAYVLSLINANRSQNGLSNVSYSNITSGQQHSDSMIQNYYFSHWDIYGEKPYMRYTLVGGRGAVDENVAYIYNSGGIDVFNSLKQMEYSMMVNDSVCCNNGHRNNILDPNHNQVSIGVSYNATIIYLTEDFINNYISWVYGTPSYSGGTVALQGSMAHGYTLSNVEISYDPTIANMSTAQLAATHSYGYGSEVAGIGYSQGSSIYYYPGITTVNATTYTLQGSNFDVIFDMRSLIGKYGAGEYTILVRLTKSTPDNSFIAATYTIYINSAGQPYTPQNI